MLFGDAPPPPRPPPPPPVPALPPWEEGEAVSTLNGFAPRRPIGTRPSPLRFGATAEQTWIDFIGQSVDRVVVNGVDHPVIWDGARIVVTGLADDNEVRIEAVGAYSRSGEGMHRFVDPVDGETYLYTQYEPADSRRVMACFEQPDMKAAYTFVVTSPTGWEILSNQRAVVTTGGGSAQTVESAVSARSLDDARRTCRGGKLARRCAHSEPFTGEDMGE